MLTVLHNAEGQHLENPLIQLRTGCWEVQGILQVGICTVLQYGSNASPHDILYFGLFSSHSPVIIVNRQVKGSTFLIYYYYLCLSLHLGRPDTKLRLKHFGAVSCT